MKTIFLTKISDRLVAIGVAQAIDDGRELINEDQVIVILVYLRQHIEANELQKNFPTICFYADWCVHPMLDRGAAQGKIAVLSGVLKDRTHSKLHNWFEPEVSDGINDVLSLHRLRAEINQLFEEEQIDTNLFKSRSVWKKFLSLLSGVILERPLMKNPKAAHNVSRVELEGRLPHELDQERVEASKMTGPSSFWRIYFREKDGDIEYDRICPSTVEPESAFELD